ncbi:hypothetical protein EYC84_009666 [Monilinia fructicola]|uniref:Uncharacterized protein n=1 Tax=Monilinia fructicola TaxID=38448 RepID=A0A5M9JAP8_MONFR|nr:hypothetical protein EYC84_009666 [Monilinia fructicola]
MLPTLQQVPQKRQTSLLKAPLLIEHNTYGRSIDNYNVSLPEPDHGQLESMKPHWPPEPQNSSTPYITLCTIILAAPAVSK